MGKIKRVKQAVTTHCDMGHRIESGCWSELQREAQTVLDFGFFLSISSLRPGQHLERNKVEEQLARQIHTGKPFRSRSGMFKGLKRKRLWHYLSNEGLSVWLEPRG